ncbi:hypothetical protein SALBM311S_02952 [Streptomyces alboniger]
MSTTEQRVAVVTGGARGIGAATAVRLAAEGRAVAVIDLDEAACKDTVEKITARAARRSTLRQGRARHGRQPRHRVRRRGGAGRAATASASPGGTRTP